MWESPVVMAWVRVEAVSGTGRMNIFTSAALGAVVQEMLELRPVPKRMTPDASCSKHNSMSEAIMLSDRFSAELDHLMH